MRAVRISPWKFGALCRFLLVLGMLAASETAWTQSAFATDATDAGSSSAATAASKSVSKSLRGLLDGAPQSAVGVSDLREMQVHVQGLVEQLKKCTVGVQVDRAWGSGVIISKDGYVLTAAHVAEAGQYRTDKAKFRLADGREVNGKRLGLFRTLDAGLMKITDPGEYPCAELGDSTSVKENKWCIAMGHPGGYQLDRGIVLRLGRVLKVGKDAITTECTLVGGDSGGPLFDMDGRVIGINSRISENLTANQHVPVNAYNDWGAWERMVKGDMWGRLPGQESGWLGVGGEAEGEAKITSVKPKSPAEHYGLKVGDVIVAFDGWKIADFEALKQAVGYCHANESVMLQVRRSDKLEDLRVRLWKRPD